MTQSRTLVWLALGLRGREWGRQNAWAQSGSSAPEVGSWGGRWDELPGRDPGSGKSRAHASQEAWRPRGRNRACVSCTRLSLLLYPLHVLYPPLVFSEA